MVCPRILILLTAAAISGCGSPPAVTPPPPVASTTDPAAAATAAPEPIAELPLTMTVEQRSTTPVPGSDGKLSLTIDDITRGQVVVSVLDADTIAIAGPISLTIGQSVPLDFGEMSYRLRLEKLSNALVGSDFATFVIEVPTEIETPEAAVTLNELQKIERLIEAVAAQEDARFIRHGSEYASHVAAEHLRTKLSAAGDRIQTADDFIDQIASRSTVSGEEYLIRFDDGRTITTREYLEQQLKELEAPAADSQLEN